MFEDFEVLVFDNIEYQYTKEPYSEDLLPKPDDFHNWPSEMKYIGDKIVDYEVQDES